jgi:hypothetical protein
VREAWPVLCEHLTGRKGQNAKDEQGCTQCGDLGRQVEVSFTCRWLHPASSQPVTLRPQPSSHYSLRELLPHTRP